MGLIRTIAVCVAGNGCSSNVRLEEFCWGVSPPIIGGCADAGEALG